MTLLSKLACWSFVAAVGMVHAIVPHSETILRERFDCIEQNHFFDEHGRLVFDQAMFIELVDGEERIQAWRLIKSPEQIPVRDWQAGGFVCRWMDGEQLREVRTNSVRETWLQYDPELAARESWPKEKRRELRRGK